MGFGGVVKGSFSPGVSCFISTSGLVVGFASKTCFWKLSSTSGKGFVGGIVGAGGRG